MPLSAHFHKIMTGVTLIVVNYIDKSFVTLAPGACVIKLITVVIYLDLTVKP